ncbi:hypothetical protein H8D79_01530 [PVC group bacterium]|nr:hypothetical protein [PVC group bacterium]
MNCRVASTFRPVLPTIPLLLFCMRFCPSEAASRGPVSQIVHHEQPKFVDVILRLDPRSTALGMPVHVVLTVTNRSEDGLCVDLMGSPRQPFHFTPAHRHDRGVVVSDRSPFWLGGFGPVNRVAAHGRFRRRVLLNEWLAFEKPGAYDILASAEMHVRPMPQTRPMFIDVYRFTVQQNLTVQVTPRDPRRLEAVAEDYDRQLRDPDRRPRQQAWQELSFLRDPVFESLMEAACQSRYGDVRARAIPRLEDRLELEELIGMLAAPEWPAVARAVHALGRHGEA